MKTKADWAEIAMKDYTVFDCCDCCDALLTDEEKSAAPRFGQCLCDHCAGEYAKANPGMEAK